jgi:hypothetical protein
MDPRTTDDPTVTDHHDDMSRPSAPAAREANVRRLLTGILPATAAMYALYQGVQQILIPLQVESIDPERKVANLAVLTSIAQ